MKRLLTRPRVRTQVLRNQNLDGLSGHGLKGTDVRCGTGFSRRKGRTIAEQQLQTARVSIFIEKS